MDDDVCRDGRRNGEEEDVVVHQMEAMVAVDLAFLEDVMAAVGHGGMVALVLGLVDASLSFCRQNSDLLDETGGNISRLFQVV